MSNATAATFSTTQKLIGYFVSAVAVIAFILAILSVTGVLPSKKASLDTAGQQGEKGDPGEKGEQGDPGLLSNASETTEGDVIFTGNVFTQKSFYAQTNKNTAAPSTTTSPYTGWTEVAFSS
jgi:hypothetical protein